MFQLCRGTCREMVIFPKKILAKSCYKTRYKILLFNQHSIFMATRWELNMRIICIFWIWNPSKTLNFQIFYYFISPVKKSLALDGQNTVQMQGQSFSTIISPKLLENANVFFLGTSVCSQNRDQWYFLRQSFAILATKKQGMCRTVALPFTFKRILRQKKNYGNSNISPCKKYINLQINPLKNTKILQDIITLELISQVSTWAKILSFKNPHIKNRPIIIIT